MVSSGCLESDGIFLARNVLNGIIAVFHRADLSSYLNTSKLKFFSFESDTTETVDNFEIKMNSLFL